MNVSEHKQGVVPRLRFPEFRDAGPWEVKRLGDTRVAKFVQDTASRSALHPDTYISTENMLPDFGGVTRASSLPPSGTIKQYQPQDILIANIRPYLKKVWQADRKGTASNDVLVVRPSSEIFPRFLGIVLASDAFISYVMAGAKGLKMPRGDIALIKQYPVPIPTQRDEQQKIADCLSSLDELIQLETQKLDALKAHKKGLMQQLFPREGETTPRLRFPEFRDAGPWEVKRLGEVAEINPPSGALPDQFIYIDLESVVDGRLIQRREINRTSAPSRAQRVIERGDILFKTVRPYQKNNLFFDFNDGKYVASTGYAQLRSLQNAQFLYQMLHTDSFVREVLTRCSGSNYPAINPSDLSSIPIGIPSKTEQQKIADCLSSLDELIQLETQKLDALKAHKKGLMQQLFPQEISA